MMPTLSILPRLGESIAKDHDSYQYLAESIRRFPNPTAFEQMLRQRGFSHTRAETLWRNTPSSGSQTLMFSSIRYSRRLIFIAWTLARNDALFGLEALKYRLADCVITPDCTRKREDVSAGIRLAEALESLGPSFP